MKNFYRLISTIFIAVLLSASAFADTSSDTSSTSSSPSSSQSVQQQVNINTADAQTIANAGLKGIADKRAQAIVAYRNQHGLFKSVDDLSNVKGISQNIIDQNRDKLTVN